MIGIDQATPPTPWTKNMTLPLNMLKPSANGKTRYVLRLLAAVRGFNIAAYAADTAIDGVFLADMLESIALYAAPQSPAALAVKSGALITEQSGYSAFTTLTELTGDAVVLQSSARRPWADPGDAPVNNPVATAYGGAVAPMAERAQYGRLCQQGPFALMKANSDLTGVEMAYSIPIGLRPGEPGCMNPFPAGWLSGKGSAKPCGDTPGRLVLKFRAKTHASLLDFTGATVTVYAQYIELDGLVAPVVPLVWQGVQAQPAFSFETGLAGCHMLAEELDENGNMTFTNLTGLKQILATVDGRELWYPDDFAEQLYGTTSQLCGVDMERFNFAPLLSADKQRTATQGLAGPNDATRGLLPGRIITSHHGPSSRSPTFASSQCSGELSINLQGVGNANRQVLSGVWKQHTNEYLKACAEWAGSPVDTAVLKTESGGISAKAAVENLQSAIPVKFNASGC